MKYFCWEHGPKRKRPDLGGNSEYNNYIRSGVQRDAVFRFVG